MGVEPGPRAVWGLARSHGLRRAGSGGGGGCGRRRGRDREDRECGSCRGASGCVGWGGASLIRQPVRARQDLGAGTTEEPQAEGAGQRENPFPGGKEAPSATTTVPTVSRGATLCRVREEGRRQLSCVWRRTKPSTRFVGSLAAAGRRAACANPGCASPSSLPSLSHLQDEGARPQLGPRGWPRAGLGKSSQRFLGPPGAEWEVIKSRPGFSGCTQAPGRTAIPSPSRAGFPAPGAGLAPRVWGGPDPSWETSGVRRRRWCVGVPSTGWGVKLAPRLAHL